MERNRIRRRLRHVVMDHAERLLPDYQYLVGATPDALRVSSADLTEAWLGLVERAHEAR